ncbi:hypothetical protein Patl1_34792 [Pistacia atlantica]|uniref:Uncharacterized protein n=1 Tax=Pistacia atlantica TaxID=434234 RepID=A0ACC0ZPL8_9ROSI|nr:hypothetical protein Patl1_34792 [Pistacia atlantica]
MMMMKTKTTALSPSPMMNGSLAGGAPEPLHDWELRPGGMLVQKQYLNSDRLYITYRAKRRRLKTGKRQRCEKEMTTGKRQRSPESRGRARTVTGATMVKNGQQKNGR